MTEPVFLFRDGKMYQTKDFVDSLTQMAEVLLVFWNPEASITTGPASPLALPQEQPEFKNCACTMPPPQHKDRGGACALG